MCLNLNDQINMYYYLLRMLFINSMVITDSKPMTDTQKINKPKQNAIDTHASHRKSKRKRTKKNYTNNQKTNF